MHASKKKRSNQTRLLQSTRSEQQCEFQVIITHARHTFMTPTIRWFLSNFWRLAFITLGKESGDCKLKTVERDSKAIYDKKIQSKKYGKKYTTAVTWIELRAIWIGDSSLVNPRFNKFWENPSLKWLVATRLKSEGVRSGLDCTPLAAYAGWVVTPCECCFRELEEECFVHDGSSSVPYTCDPGNWPDPKIFSLAWTFSMSRLIVREKSISSSLLSEKNEKRKKHLRLSSSSERLAP